LHADKAATLPAVTHRKRVCDSRAAYRRKSMSRTVKRVLYWSPRVACILFALFLSLFALDIFGEGYGFWLTVQALLIHLVPVFVIAAVLLITWRHEWLAAVLFLGLGLLYAADVWGQEHWTAVAVISGSLAIIGVLFLLSWVFRRELAAR